MMWQSIDKAPLNKMLAIIGKKNGRFILTHGLAILSTEDKMVVLTDNKCKPRLFVELPEGFSP